MRIFRKIRAGGEGSGPAYSTFLYRVGVRSELSSTKTTSPSVSISESTRCSELRLGVQLSPRGRNRLQRFRNRSIPGRGGPKTDPGRARAGPNRPRPSQRHAVPCRGLGERGRRSAPDTPASRESPGHAHWDRRHRLYGASQVIIPPQRVWLDRDGWRR